MTSHALIEEALTRSVVGAFFDVYNEMGYGCLEQLYAVALATELRERVHGAARLLLHFGPEKAQFKRLVHQRNPRDPRNPRSPRGAFRAASRASPRCHGDVNSRRVHCTPGASRAS